MALAYSRCAPGNCYASRAAGRAVDGPATTKSLTVSLYQTVGWWSLAHVKIRSPSLLYFTNVIDRVCPFSKIGFMVPYRFQQSAGLPSLGAASLGEIGGRQRTSGRAIKLPLRRSIGVKPRQSIKLSNNSWLSRHMQVQCHPWRIIRASQYLGEALLKAHQSHAFVHFSQNYEQRCCKIPPIVAIGEESARATPQPRLRKK